MREKAEVGEYTMLWGIQADLGEANPQVKN